MKVDPSNHISFSDEDYEGVQPGHNDSLVFQLDIAYQDVVKILVDNSSSVHILYYLTFKMMLLDGYELQDEDRTPLYDFENNLIPIMGTVTLPVVFGIEPQQIGLMVKFYVVDKASSYNAMIDRPTLANLKAITSMSHMKMKFPTPSVVWEMKAFPECHKHATPRPFASLRQPQRGRRGKGESESSDDH